MKKKFDYEQTIFAAHKSHASFLDSSWTFFQFYKKELRQFPHKKLKVLDIGCGAGGLVKGLKEIFPYFSYDACDITKKGIREAKKNAEGIHFFVGDAEKLPVKNNTYDIVIMNSILDHLEHPEKAVGEVYRVLKKGGTYLATTPVEKDLLNIHGFFSLFPSFRRHRLKYLGHIHAFNRYSIQALIKKPGFKVASVVLDWFYFSQLVDILYYPFIALVRKGPSFSLQNFGSKNTSPMQKAVKKIRTSFIFLENLESFLTLNIPIGFFSYVKAIKK